MRENERQSCQRRNHEEDEEKKIEVGGETMAKLYFGAFRIFYLFNNMW